LAGRTRRTPVEPRQQPPLNPPLEAKAVHAWMIPSSALPQAPCCYYQGMGSSLVPLSTILQTAQTPSPETPAPVGCWFELSEGVKCGLTETIGRGLCSAHYHKLRRAGLFRKPNPEESTEQVALNVDILSRAKDRLERLTPYAARKLRRAIEAAADKGDSKPIEWLLTHTKVVEPVNARSSSPSQSTGVTINVLGTLAGVEIKKKDGE